VSKFPRMAVEKAILPNLHGLEEVPTDKPFEPGGRNRKKKENERRMGTHRGLRKSRGGGFPQVETKTLGLHNF